MNEFLDGKTITGIKVARDKESILFSLGDGEVIASAYGDCCSRTWIEHIELPAGGFPAKVLECIDLNLKEDDASDYETIRYYGFKVKTDKGEILIDYRNSSNGYYGGSLQWPGEYCHDGSNKDWVEVSND